MSRMMMIALIVALGAVPGRAQELFPLTMPASTIPAKTVGIRLSSDYYENPNKARRISSAVKLMYGLTPKLMVIVGANGSNHHDRFLPADFPEHTGNQDGSKRPFLFNGVSAYLQYRFLSIDGYKTHFRIAAYATGAYRQVAHDEAEPDLSEDTKGVGGGLIVTGLRHRFAWSVTAGVVLPSKFTGQISDPDPGLPSVPAKVYYSAATPFSLSLGYLVYPRAYSNYRQLNVNAYLELTGNAFNGATVYAGHVLEPDNFYKVEAPYNPGVGKNAYLEAHPAVQLIVHSNLRIDLGMGFPVAGRSYARNYPIYMVGIQRYLFPRK